MQRSQNSKNWKTIKDWFAKARSANVPVGGTVLREKALEIAGLDIEDFVASNGWIDRFKKQCNVTYKTICGESKSVDMETVEHWRQGLSGKLDGYALKDIFNADETGLFFNMLPGKTMCFRGEDCSGGKLSKQRLTVLLITNADGSEKLRPLVIGKAKKPRCFHQINAFPTEYSSSRRAWMTAKIFTEQLQALDRKMRAQHRKVLLVLDQCLSHPVDLHLRNV